MILKASPVAAWLVSSDWTSLNVLAVQFWKSYGSEDTNHLLYEYLRKNWIHCHDLTYRKIHDIDFIEIGDNKIFQPFLKPLLTFGHRGNEMKRNVKLKDQHSYSFNGKSDKEFVRILVFRGGVATVLPADSFQNVCIKHSKSQALLQRKGNPSCLER